MNRTLVTVISASLALVVSSAGKCQAEAPQWIDLFDGQSLEGWSANVEGGVSVKEGEIRILSKANLWLLHEATFDDFELTVEAKMPDDAYNSGIGFRCTRQGKKTRGYQCELARAESGMIYAIGSGWVWPQEAAQRKQFVAEAKNNFDNANWNSFRIRCEGNQIQIWINDQQIADVHDDRFTRGSIALQHHGKGGVHRFRNVRIRNLQDADLDTASDDANQKVESVRDGALAEDDNFRLIRDVEYASIGKQSLLLDLYLPNVTENAPLVVWVHGGAWRGGSKANMPLKWLVPYGFAIASIDYRLAPMARFPANLHDCKAAVRFLRGEQANYGFNADRVGVAGSSAGGHLAALLGTTNRHRELEGGVGGYLDQSSSVDAIVDYYGPTNFLTILKQSTPHGLSVRVPAFQMLLGGQPEEKAVLAKMASPVFYVDSDDPPLLLIHGDQDPQVPINQSHELHAAYKQHALDVRFEVVHGGVHGGDLFFDVNRRELVLKFLSKHLR